MEKNDDSPEDVKRATSVEREIKRGEKDDTFEGYPRQEKKKRWEHCDKTPSKRSKRQKTKSNGDCCETRKNQKKKAKFTKVSVFGEPCTFPKINIIPRHCLTKEDHINILSTGSRRCPPDCQKETVLRRLRPVSQRIKELAQPSRQRMLISLQQGATVLPPALLDNLVRTLENETCLTPEQAAIASRKKKLVKKKKGKKDTSRQKETSKLNKPSIGSATTGSFDKDSVHCQYLIAERFVKSMLKWKCPIPKSEFNDISKVIVDRLVSVLDYTPPQNEDRKSQQLRFLADTIACWITGVLSDVAQLQEKNLEAICKKKEEEWAAAEEEEDEDEEEKVDEDVDEVEIVDEEEEEDEDVDEDKDEDEDEDEDEGEDEDEDKDKDESAADVDKDVDREQDKEEEIKDDAGKEIEQATTVDGVDEKKDDTDDVTEPVTQPDDEAMKIVDDKDNEVIDATAEQVKTEEEVGTEKQVEPTEPLETVTVEMEPEKSAKSIADIDKETDLATEAETSADTNIETATQEEASSKVDTEVGMETETAPQADIETETGTQAEMEMETGTQAEAETEAGTQAEAETEAGTQAEAETEAGTQAKMEMETEPKTQTETGMEMEAEPETAEAEDTLEKETEEERFIPPEPETDAELVPEDEKETSYTTIPPQQEPQQDETEALSTILPEKKVTPEEEKWKEILVKGDLEELFKSDIPFVTFGKIFDTVYKMIESVPENAGEDPITNGIHRVIYEKLTNMVTLEDSNLLTEELKDVIDVVCGKIANWLKTVLSKSQMAYMEKCLPVVESKEIRDWTKWLEHVSDVAIDWNTWLRSVIEKVFEMSSTNVTRGEWKNWTKSVDTGALLWRKFHLQTIHQAHRNITMLTGRNVVKTGTKTPCTVSEELLSTELQTNT